jgi:hypothetical protein
MFNYAIAAKPGSPVSLSDLQTMVDAVGTLSNAFCDGWGIDGFAGTVLSAVPTKPTRHSIVFTWQGDDANVPGAEGFHDEQNGVPYAELFWNPVLQNGGGILDGGSAGVSCASVFAHELFETIVDEYVNDWIMMRDGRFIAKEVCDPVQMVPMMVNLGGKSIMLSDAVFPRYFDNQAPTDGSVKFSLSGKAVAPLQLLPGGYQIIFDPARIHSRRGPVVNVWGATVPEWVIEMKMAKMASRTNKRARALLAAYV